jgi:GT2 family glycosyltransferase
VTLAWPDTSSAFAERDVAVAAIVLVDDEVGSVADTVHQLRRAATTVRLRTVVVDRTGARRTAAVLSEHPDVDLITLSHRTSAARAMHAAIESAGDAEYVLFLSPDVALDPGAVGRLLARARTRQDVAAVAPLVRTADGDVDSTLGREPTVLGALGDRVLGASWRRRPAVLSEYVRDPRAYAWAHPARLVDSDVLLLSRAAAVAAGVSDDRFGPRGVLFDMQRRIRDAGGAVWFDPAAGATRRSGGVTDARLHAADARVDRSLYKEVYAPRFAGLYRAVSGTRRARGAEPRRRAHRAPSTSVEMPPASVIVPAHDEATVIARTLAPLAQLAADGSLEVIVVCNGCSDDTATRARAFAGVTVLETDEASKVAALNLGDAHATRWPRVYLDADIRVPAEALAPVIRSLADGVALAGRPTFSVDVAHATPLVRAYQRARARMPSMSRALWGAGVYALSREGHARLGSFPDVIADDLYVDRLFTVAEKTFPDTAPVSVASPRTTEALLGVLTRARRGPAQQGVDSAASSVQELVRSIRGPRSACDALVFAAFALAARRRARRAAATRWERDESSRGKG